jgi:hypothetical protein
MFFVLIKKVTDCEGNMKRLIMMVLSVVVISVPVWAYALEVGFLVGDVKIVRAGSELKGINVGTKVQTDDVVKTGKKSLVTIVYNDGSEIKMTENSIVKIGKMTQGTDTAPAVVIAGIVTTKFTKLSKGTEARRSVYTPTTVCAVRGTEFTVAVSDGADSRVELTEGSLDVHNPYGGQQIQAGKKVKTSVAGAPTDDSDFTGSAAEWKGAADESLAADPSGKGDEFQTYLSDLSVRSSASSQKIDELGNGMSNIKDKKTLDKKGKDLDAVNGSVEEDLYLGDASGAAIEQLASRFEKDKSEIAKKFQALKEESNKVREQQQRNYENIQAVREAYKKAHDEIMNKFQDSKKQIKSGTDLDSVKPKIN